jgi:carbon monoxide dehydrogenase subunit G
MIIDGKLVVAVTRDEAWANLSDLPSLAPLLPGCESIQPLDGGAYAITAQAKVGPIKTRLAGKMSVVELSAPEAMRLRVEGQDTLTGSHVRANLGFTLASVGERQTEVQYSADVLISGRLGTIGQGIMRETVATMLGEFSRRLNARITGETIEETGLAALSVKAAARSLKAGVTSLLKGQALP